MGIHFFSIRILIVQKPAVNNRKDAKGHKEIQMLMNMSIQTKRVKDIDQDN